MKYKRNKKNLLNCLKKSIEINHLGFAINYINLLVLHRGFKFFQKHIVPKIKAYSKANLIIGKPIEQYIKDLSKIKNINKPLQQNWRNEFIFWPPLGQGNIPKKIHFIWIGPKKLPDEFLKNIMDCRLASVQHGWEINLWTDKPARYLTDEPYRNIQIKNVNDLKTKLTRNNHPTASENKQPVEQNLKQTIHFLLTIIEQECHGFHNFAAASDMLRLLILYKEGGIYCDTDTGIQKNQELTDLYAPKEILFHVTQTQTGNDYIAAKKCHPLILKLMQTIEANYRDMGWDELDKKRYPYQKQPKTPKTKATITNGNKHSLKNHKLSRTLKASGPQVIHDVLFGQVNSSRGNQREYVFDNEMQKFFITGRAGTWLRIPEKQKYAFTTEDIKSLKKHNIFTKQEQDEIESTINTINNLPNKPTQGKN